ncbi:glycosyl hydrolase [Flectobacillus sp. BAB-3569]|uniref:glycosyl hydrolase n=1 Tax=Flectobacillus sp. BAB-3569 TaxID=1509483 RepID=UPI000BA30D71|nr:glycosyl hydrolase [Flectobacillus sp. BAB-3569]PAC28702.1 glycoside hydrolase family 2 protein [Flectobacillus sp. BAB-3569]
MLKKTLILPLLGLGIMSHAQTQWPAITPETKPWTRWWWNGSQVTPKGLTAALEKYKQVGLGGTEVTVIYGVQNQEKEFINYLSPDWVKVFEHTLSESKRLGMGIDLANASGWPFGGPWVSLDDACKYVAEKSWTLKEGQTLSESVTYIQKPLLQAGNKSLNLKDLKEPYYLNPNLQKDFVEQIRFEHPIPLQVLMAYSDKNEILNLTDKVDKNGHLNWTAPKGEWKLLALFMGLHGKQVERAGPGGEGEVIDHFSTKAIQNYLAYFDKAFKNANISYLRGYFNDSYEVDDAKGESDWTPDMFNEFQKRRGYDLRNFLPALFGKDTPEKNARILCDYRETISDLILEKYMGVWSSWSHKNKKIIRNQSHGAPANILDLYVAADIPEAEGMEVPRLKFASSAANLTGKKLVASETATWLNEHFVSNLADVKKAIDLMFLGGINHIFYHGTAYSPENEPWPGRLFYAATEFTPANPWWKDFASINQYVTRVQSFLQKSTADNDVLFYFPISDSWSKPSKSLLRHYDGLGKELGLPELSHLADELLEKGYNYDFISDSQVQKLIVSGGKIQSANANYKVILVPKCTYIPLATMQKLNALAKAGAKVLFIDALPESVAGWGNLEEKQKAYSQIKNSIHLQPTNESIQSAKVGLGQISVGKSFEKLLAFNGVKEEALAQQGLSFIRKKMGAETVYFIWNKNSTGFSGWVNLQRKGISSAIFNPMTGESGIGKVQNTGSETSVFISLQPNESLIVKVSPTLLKGKEYPFFKPSENTQELKGDWQVSFVEGGPELPATRTITNLSSWTTWSDEALNRFSGTASYKTTFAKPASNAQNWILDLGEVHESARVILNGKAIATLVGPSFTVTIPNDLLQNQNTLEIQVSNLMANRMAWMDKNGMPWKKYYNINMAAKRSENRNAEGLFDASKWSPKPSGLVGPVRLTEAKRVE